MSTHTYTISYKNTELYTIYYSKDDQELTVPLIYFHDAYITISENMFCTQFDLETVRHKLRHVVMLVSFTSVKQKKSNTK
jgi:hypothetical protein